MLARCWLGWAWIETRNEPCDGWGVVGRGLFRFFSCFLANFGSRIFCKTQGKVYIRDLVYWCTFIQTWVSESQGFLISRKKLTLPQDWQPTKPGATTPKWEGKSSWRLGFMLVFQGCFPKLMPTMISMVKAHHSTSISIGDVFLWSMKFTDLKK